MKPISKTSVPRGEEGITAFPHEIGIGLSFDT